MTNVFFAPVWTKKEFVDGGQHVSKCKRFQVRNEDALPFCIIVSFKYINICCCGKRAQCLMWTYGKKKEAK